MDSHRPESARMGREEYFLRMATLVSLRSTCLRRHTGCVLVDVRNHVLATGYNGVPQQMAHCVAGWHCEGAYAKPGESLDKCVAIHAEQNALLQCKDVYAIDTAYCTDSSCIHCTKLLLNTTCHTIVCSREYPHDEAVKLWKVAGRKLKVVELEWPLVLNQSHSRTEEP